nr:2-acylglycerol O-acyltransferase 2-A-like [Oncorhynchus nerka]
MKIQFAPLNIPLRRRLQTAAVLQWVFSFLALGKPLSRSLCRRGSNLTVDMSPPPPPEESREGESALTDSDMSAPPPRDALLAGYVLLCVSDWWVLAALYAGWLYLDRDTPNSGGRRSEWLRKLVRPGNTSRLFPYQEDSKLNHTGSYMAAFRSVTLQRLLPSQFFRDYFPLNLIKMVDLDPGSNYIFGFHPHGVLVAGGFGNFCTEASGFSSLFPGLTPYLLMLPFWFRVPFFRDYIMCGG